MSKKYYWLKLKEDFFRSKEIKKLRKIAGGDTYTIIYLKLQLLSIKTDGMIEFDGTEQNMIEQLALEIDEDSDNISMTITYLINNKLIESNENQNILVSSVIPLIGKETESAERVRKHRELHQKALHCNDEVTKCNTELELEKELEKEHREKDAGKSTCDNFKYSVISKWNEITGANVLEDQIPDQKINHLRAYSIKQIEETFKKYDSAVNGNWSWVTNRTTLFDMLLNFNGTGFLWWMNKTTESLKKSNKLPSEPTKHPAFKLGAKY